LHGETGAIKALHLVSGDVISGDFFVDCSGFSSLLLGKALNTPFVDWSHLLACDSAIAVPCSREGASASFTTSTARSVGWQWRIPLQHREGNGLVYSSAHCNDSAAEDMLFANLPGNATGSPRRFRFKPGHRAQFWNRNCVGIGFAGGFLEPLESTAIQLIQNGIARLIEFLPDRSGSPILAAEYNRVTQIEWERIRDFILGHYVVSQRPEPFWRDCCAISLPDTLRYKLELWRASGRVALFEGESHLEPSWVAILLGNGYIPLSHDARADAVDSATLVAAMTRRRQEVTRTAQSCPDHQAWLDRNCKAGT